MRSIGKSDFAGLVKYISDEKGKTERMAYGEYKSVSTVHHDTDNLEDVVIFLENKAGLRCRPGQLPISSVAKLFDDPSHISKKGNRYEENNFSR